MFHKQNYFIGVCHKFDINYVIQNVIVIFQLSKYFIHLTYIVEGSRAYVEHILTGENVAEIELFLSYQILLLFEIDSISPF